MAAIESLANGIDPVTGQPLPDQGPYHHPRVIRALFTVLEQARRASEGQAPNRQRAVSLAGASGLSERVGKPWTTDEDEQLIAEFHAAVDFKAMAKMHGRTRGAIVSRLTELGKIKPKYDDPAPEMEPDFEVL
ncbi:MAG TPA: SANT/Myb-like DNA-binding domain-containing protein [Pirellulaceae bacterium]|nr:SANT/Myb-like DNA-binding domain-containing protein [Pirellulaceae bacterium]